jgi:hypothetical protein
MKLNINECPLVELPIQLIQEIDNININNYLFYLEFFKLI